MKKAISFVKRIGSDSYQTRHHFTDVTRKFSDDIHRKTSAPLLLKQHYSIKIAPPKEILFNRFKFLEPATTGSHYVWKTIDQESGATFWLKQLGPTINEVQRAQELGGNIDYLFRETNPAELQLESEREAVASRLVKLFLGKEGRSPQCVYSVKTVVDDWPQFWVASQDVANYHSLYMLGKITGEKFFVGDRGETRLWFDNTRHVETYGRIRTKFALIAACEKDSNPQNIGISDEGEKCPIATIDHGQCLEKFPYSHLSPEEFGQLLASGKTDSPLPVIDLKTLTNIRRREVVRAESIDHIAHCFMDGTAINQIFMEGFSWTYPREQRLQIQKIAKELHRTGAGFVAADILIKNGWDKSPEMAKEIFSQPENRRILDDYMSKQPGQKQTVALGR